MTFVDAKVRDWTPDQYHDREHEAFAYASRSTVVKLDESPELVHAILSGTWEPLSDRKPFKGRLTGQELGTLQDWHLLTPEVLRARVGRKGSGAEIELTPLAERTVAARAEALRRTSLGAHIERTLGEATRAQQVLTAIHQPTGVRVRCMVDFVTAVDGVVVVGDLKTMAKHPVHFGRDCDNYDYLVQAAWYHDMVVAAAPAMAELLKVPVEAVEAAAWCWLVVGGDPPVAATPEPLGYQMDAGRRERDRLLKEFARRLDEDDWESRCARGGGVTTLRLPHWSKYEKARVGR